MCRVRRVGGAAVVLPILLVACSSSSETAGPCAARSGQFRESYVERSGSCGPISERIVTISGPPKDGVDPPCTGSRERASDNCSVTYDETCPDATIAGGKLRKAGTSRWNSDGSAGSAIIEWDLIDANGKIVCHSTYDQTFTKQ